uniref:Uncharacterized protein n=1 Tax=Glossina palpalis gambiensis TaxID=67801 RepID=A0A1B0BVU7_9MUSC
MCAVEYLSRQDYKHIWRNRGGHQLVVDTEERLIYSYEGWDGFQDLSDLWVFEITANCWTQLCAHSEQMNGPAPRSCHKMIFDPVSKNIFMLGRYLDNSIRTKEYIKSDFYLYDTRAGTWLQICDDTSQRRQDLNAYSGFHKTQKFRSANDSELLQLHPVMISTFSTKFVSTSYIKLLLHHGTFNNAYKIDIVIEGNV